MKDIKEVAVLIRRKRDIWEGCRSTLGLAVENFICHMFIIDAEIELGDDYRENLNWLKEMECGYYSNNTINCEKYGFEFLTLNEIEKKLSGMDLIIPF